MNDFMFGIPSNTAVVTSSYVVNDKLPVLYVSHEYDEEEGDIWQFHCGNDDYDMSKMLLISLGDILTIDSSLVELANLPVNSIAKRNSIDDQWVISSESQS